MKKWTSEKIYSDDNTEEVITSYEGTDVELEINALAPQDRVILFGQLYEKGFLRKSSDDRAPEVAVGWRERKLNGKYEFKWLYVGSLQRVSARRQALKRENCHLQQRASRAVSTSVASTICMRYLLMNPTL
jgi:phi13 family phage major tail protein